MNNPIRHNKVSSGREFLKWYTASPFQGFDGWCFFKRAGRQSHVDEVELLSLVVGATAFYS